MSKTKAPHRVELAAAIQAAAKIERAVANIQKSETRATAALTAAEDRLRDATAAVSTARTAETNNYVKAIEGGETQTRTASLRRSRDRVLEAEDEVELARGTLETISSNLRNTGDDLRAAQQNVTAAVHKVIAAELSQLLQEAQAMQAALGLRRLVISFLSSECRESFEDLHIQVWDYLSDVVFPLQQQQWITPPAYLSPWPETLEALHSDANAPLPSN